MIWESTGEACPDNAALLTPLKTQLLGADHEAFLVLKGV
jgi:hypothetical protein